MARQATGLRSIYILADDLAGSADAADYFRSPRRRVRVTWEADTPWDLALGPEVVQVYDSESRALEPEDAARRIARVMAPFALTPDLRPRVFKKVDSTLRGNLGAELDAALSVLGWPFAVLAPSFPAAGRVVRGGRVFVDGVAVTQTSFSQDPRTPVRSDRIADVLRETSSAPVVEVGLDDVRRGVSHLAGALQGRVHGGTAVLDAETQADLDVIAGAIAELNVALPSGSAGLASSLAGVWGGGASGGEAVAPPAEAANTKRPRCTDVLVAVGSPHPAAREQLAALRGAQDVTVVELSAARLADPVRRPAELAAAHAAAHAAAGRVLAVALSPQRVSGNGAPSAPRFELDLAQVALAWIERGDSDRHRRLGIVATGGDTTLALCRGLRARALWPEGEVAAGVPWSGVEAPRTETLLVSKAGGFGGPTILGDAVRFLMQAQVGAQR